MSKQFNTSQRHAIDLDASNILVAAAAGSGKTTVLVERIVRLLIDGTCRIDQLLVLTFTEAAAAEMKQRLEQRLKDMQKTNPSALIEENIKRVPDAYISTMHSFCQRMIREFYYRFDDVYSDFSIIDPNLQYILQDQALNDVMSRYETNPDYQLFTDLFIEGHQKQRIAALMNRLYQLQVSIPNVDLWYEGILEPMQETISDLSKWSLWQQYVLPEIQRLLSLAHQRLTRVFDEATMHGIDFYFEKQYPIHDALMQSAKANAYDSYQVQYHFYQEIKFPQLRFPKDFDETLKESFKEHVDGFKAIFKQIKESYFVYTMEEHLEHLSFNQTYILFLKQLVQDYQLAYKQQKQAKRLLDFNDLEERMIELLVCHKDIRQTISKRFKQIMIDEYQDTNGVQEHIVTMIANASNPSVPMFLVGDIKQSIYGFRQAEPKLFKSKYVSYQQLSPDIVKTNESVRIDLALNYRSRKQVLESINFIFDQILDEAFGGIKYYEDKQARLNFDPILGKDDEMLAVDKQHFVSQLLTIDFDSMTQFKVNNQTIIPQQLDPRALEAHLVAQKILELKALKQRSFNDFVLVARSTTAFDTFSEVFHQYNIPFDANVNTGLFETFEAKAWLSLLRIFVEETDETILAYLRLPLACHQVNEDDLVSMKNMFFEETIKQAFYQTNQPSIVQARENLFAFKQQYHTLPLMTFIDTLMQDTLFSHRFSFMEDGLQRQANIDLLYRQLDAMKDQGLKAYIQTQMYLMANKDAPPAIKPTTQEAVKMMTIHKSKGLEFPIVFLVHADKNFNLADLKGDLLIHKEVGIAFKYGNYHETGVRIKLPTLYQELLKIQYKKEMIEEEMRLLYVALTRAKQQFFITAIDDGKPKSSDHESVIFKPHQRQFRNYLDMIKLSLCRVDSGLSYFNERYSLLCHEHVTSLSDCNHELTTTKIDSPQVTIVDTAMIPLNQTAVTAFHVGDVSIGARYGTLMHAFFETLPIVDYTSTSFDDYLKTYIKTYPDASILNKHDLFAFIQSELYAWMKTYPIKREYAFSAKTSDGVVRGKIDLLIIKEDYLCLVDYKTDHELTQDKQEDYKKQLKSYQTHLSKVFKQPIQLMIYLVNQHQMIHID